MNAEKVGLGLTVYVHVKGLQRESSRTSRRSSKARSGEVDYLLKAVVSDMAGYDRLRWHLF